MPVAINAICDSENLAWRMFCKAFCKNIKINLSSGRNPMKKIYLIALLLSFILSAVHVHADRTVITVNNSSQPIWVGAEGKLVDPANPFNPTRVNPNRGGWYLAPNGGKVTVTVPNGWEGRFWGRTNCNFDANGNGSCETGNCTAGLYCDGLWGKSSTLAEIKFNGWNDLDFYDVSLIDVRV
ncbi:MAG: hypothetical protein EOP48_09105 [Sphingobacteriales bacterium]|nr:MAG: hypothetical protein EOP48_09105 [Sphingobacteriales bacterium]